MLSGVSTLLLLRNVCHRKSRLLFSFHFLTITIANGHILQDIQAMNVLLTGVRESILWKHLRDGDMI